MLYMYDDDMSINHELISDEIDTEADVIDIIDDIAHAIGGGGRHERERSGYGMGREVGRG